MTTENEKPKAPENLWAKLAEELKEIDSSATTDPDAFTTGQFAAQFSISRESARRRLSILLREKKVVRVNARRASGVYLGWKYIGKR